MIPIKTRLSIYKRMIELLESPRKKYDYKYADDSYKYILDDIHKYGYCVVLKVLRHHYNYKNTINIANLIELLEYRPLGIDTEHHFWFPMMIHEGTERRLNILKEIINKITND